MTTHDEAVKKIRDMIKGIDYAMLVTENADGELHSRPMSTQEAEFDGDLWFFTESNSEKVEDIQHNSVVNVSYSHDGKYISVAGNASIVMDVAKKKELWREELRILFQDGPESPDVALIKVEAHSAQYWDTPSGLLGQAAAFIKVALTGNNDAFSENKKVSFK